MSHIGPVRVEIMPIEFTLNGRAAVGRSNESIIEIAKRYGIEIPRLCYK